MRVLVTWADSQSANLGVRAVAEGNAALARMAWGAETEVDFQDYVKGDSAITISRKAMLSDFWRPGGPITSKLRQYDVILDSGAGDGFTDIYGLKRLTAMVYLSRQALSLGIPSLMGPQTIGPFETKLGRGRAKPYLERSAAVISRDGASTSFASEMGRPVDLQATDVVFALEQFNATANRDVIVNVSGLLWFPNPHVASDRYRSDVARLVEALESRGRKVTLLSHVTTKSSVSDDLAAIKNLVQDIGSGREVVAPNDLRSAREILASAEMVIGGRMHACLNAISTGTPAIPWAYSRKFGPLLGDLGWKSVVDLQSSDDPVGETLTYLEREETPSAQTDLQKVLTRAHGKLAAAAALMGSVVDARG